MCFQCWHDHDVGCRCWFVFGPKLRLFQTPRCQHLHHHLDRKGCQSGEKFINTNKFPNTLWLDVAFSCWDSASGCSTSRKIQWEWMLWRIDICYVEYISFIPECDFEMAPRSWNETKSRWKQIESSGFYVILQRFQMLNYCFLCQSHTQCFLFSIFALQNRSSMIKWFFKCIKVYPLTWISFVSL